jgi:hypothetical protein
MNKQELEKLLEYYMKNGTPRQVQEIIEKLRNLSYE